MKTCNLCMLDEVDGKFGSITEDEIFKARRIHYNHENYKHARSRRAVEAVQSARAIKRRKILSSLMLTLLSNGIIK